MSDNPQDKPAPAPTTAADRLAKEPIDRLLGRLNVDQRASLAYGFANRCLRVVLPQVLDGVGRADVAKKVRALSEIKDDATATAARDFTKQLSEAADKQRDKEEESGRVTPESTTAGKALSFALATVKAALGETGLRITQTGGSVQAGPAVKKEPVDTGVQRALLAGKYLQQLAALQNPAAAQEEESLQRQETMAILKQPRRI